VSSIARGLELSRSFDGPLLEACVEGDAQAWRELHRRYFPVVVAFLRRLGMRERDLDDSAQNVFLQVHRSLRSFRFESELSTWLYRFCISEARNVRRRARVFGAVVRVLSLAPLDQQLSAPSLCDAAARERIDRALSVLPEHERATFVLYELQGVPGKQIADILRCTEATVWRRLHDARKAFRLAYETRT